MAPGVPCTLTLNMNPVHGPRGTLCPDEYSLLHVTYTPKHTGTFSSENFTLSTTGGNKLTLNLRGTAAGPVVTFSSRTFNFGNVVQGQTPSRVLYIQNHSDVPVYYEFQLDPLVGLGEESRAEGAMIKGGGYGRWGIGC